MSLENQRRSVFQIACPLFALVVFQNCGKGLLRNLHRTELSHALFPFLLLFQKLLLTGDISAVTLGEKRLFSELSPSLGR